jgi:hypothetical protein
MRKVRSGSGAGYSRDRIDPAVKLAEKGGIDYLAFECLAERTIALAQKRRMQNPLEGFDSLLEERMNAVLSLCRRNGLRIISNMGAAVTGDDVLDAVRAGGFRFIETDLSVESLDAKLVSADAYLGVGSILEALADGADVIPSGHVADASLFLAPLVHEFGWLLDNWNQLGQGTVVGHLMECAGQVTGRYFVDSGYKEISGFAHLGFSIAEVSAGYRDGFVGEAQISYAGPGAYERAQLAREILDGRLRALPFSEFRFDYIGVNSILGEKLSPLSYQPNEVCLCVAGCAESLETATMIPSEVETLYTNGTTGGGGVIGSTREMVAILSTLIDREKVQPTIHYEVS